MSTFEQTEAIFRAVDPPLWVVTSGDAQARGGLLATFVCKASIVQDTPRVTIGIGKHHHTWSLIHASRRFALHLLGPDQLAWVERFGMRSGRDGDKFAGIERLETVDGVPILQEAPAVLECRVEAGFDTGDRTLYLAEITRSRLNVDLRDFSPLTMRTAVPRLPESTLKLLGTLYQHDAGIDRAAILSWREQMSLNPTSEETS